MKQFFLMSALSLAVALTTASASDLAIYSGPTNPNFISQAAANANAKAIMNDERIKAIFENIEEYGDGDEVGYNSPLGRWLKAHTGNGQQDVFISASGTAPSAIYQFPNADPDGSNIENFIEDGNVFINVADWILYMSYEGGSRSVNNGPNGAVNVFDIPWVHFWPPGGHGVPSIPMAPTEAGKKYLPSLKEFGSDRLWHLGQFLGTDWEITAFATGKNNTSFADPAVAVNKKYGGIIASMWHKAQPNWVGPDPRGIGVIEFIANWLTAHSNITNTVNPQDNPTTTWEDINGDDTAHNTQNALNTVSLIYFLPRDRDPQPDIDTRLNTLIKSAQQFYANEMEQHGYGSKTFTYKTDASGNAVINYVYSNFTDAYYQKDTYNKIKNEILKQFDTSRHIYLVAADISSESIGTACGVAHSSWHSSDNQLWWRDTGGLFVLPISGQCFNPSIAAHELGHTFGLVHDFRDDAYLMGYGTQSRLSHCAAEWLSVHRFFTNKISFNENTTLEMRSQHGGRFQFQITDPDGLHQAQLLIPATMSDPSPGTKLHSCKALNGKTSSIVTFVVNGLSDASNDKVTLQIIDVHGNIAERQFSIQTVVDSSPTIVSVMPASVEAPPISEQLTLSLNITNGVAVAGYQATLQFDNEALQYITSENGDYLADNAFFSPSLVNGNAVLLLSTVLSGESDGDGTLATLTFEVIGHKTSTLTLSEVILSDSEGNIFSPQVENGEVVELEPTQIVGDVNRDGVVNITDLVLVTKSMGQTGQTDADINNDGVVNIADLVLVAGKIGTDGSAPLAEPQALELPTAADVQLWLTQAQHAGLTDAIAQRGIQVLEQLLTMLLPKETALLPNYPNPFNPETWLPYQLAKPAQVTVRIYSIEGQLVRVLVLGHQPAGIYASRDHAAYWDGKNEVGEPVASGVYFYTLIADDFTASRRMLIWK